ncbi:6-carboxytetrahydropterin synthase [bacterium]|nr:6-carboxytetrahydropterin synthase [bacterium]
MHHSTTLHLAKQNFKFSSAHFLIFDENSAEMLHGHNYQVKVDIFAAVSAHDEAKGYFVDFNVLKKIIKDQCDVWDEHVLLPEKHPDMKYQISQSGKNYDINFRDRFYSFPIIETIWLPITNTSVENLSLLFAKSIFKKMKDLGVDKVRVSVEETRGQSASSVVGS